MSEELAIMLANTSRGSASEVEARISVISDNLDAFFLLIVAILIYFMQCGFAILECGAVRSKNATNILIKNMLDSFIGAGCYWLIGWALAFGDGNLFLGYSNWATHGLGPADMPMVFFHYTFAVTSSTIVSGSVAERCNFVAYIIYSIVFTGFMYPVVSHWAWAEQGWLYQGLEFTVGNVTDSVSYQDFAGSGVVHLVGGTAAFIGALLLGPRLGRFSNMVQDEEEVRGHSVPMAALGGYILFFGFFAFNGGSQASISQPGDAAAVGGAIFNTIVSGSFGAMVTVVGRLITNYCTGENKGEFKWSLLSTINGALAGMVAICAGCNVMWPWSAAVTGAVAGIAYQLVSWLMIRLQVDDPLDAVAVHFGAGLWGIIAVTLFDFEKGAAINPSMKSAYFVAVNTMGATAIFAWTTFVSGIVFLLLKICGILRVSPEVEKKGLDVEEHGEAAYPLSAYRDGRLLNHLKELFQEIADPDSALKRKCSKHQAIEAALEDFKKSNVALVNGALMMDDERESEKKQAQLTNGTSAQEQGQRISTKI